MDPQEERDTVGRGIDARPAGVLRIAALEDDPSVRLLYDLAFAKAGHAISSFHRVSDFMHALRHRRFDAFVLDWHLPDGTSAMPLRWVREHLGWGVPVIVVSADGSERSVVDALREGADEYLVKPVRVAEAIARLEAHVRRVTRPPVEDHRVGPYQFGTIDRTLRVDGQSVDLTPKQFDLALLFFRNPGRLFSRQELLLQIWGTTAELETRTVDSHVSQLRRRAGLDGAHGWVLRPVYGQGYRLEPAPSGESGPGV